MQAVEVQRQDSMDSRHRGEGREAVGLPAAEQADIGGVRFRLRHNFKYSDPLTLVYS